MVKSLHLTRFLHVSPTFTGDFNALGPFDISLGASDISHVMPLVCLGTVNVTVHLDTLAPSDLAHAREDLIAKALVKERELREITQQLEAVRAAEKEIEK